MKAHPSFEWFITPHWLRRYGPLKLVSASLLDRVALHYFTLYASLNGVLQGVFTISAFVLKQSLDASELEIGVFSALGPMALLIGIFGSEIVVGRDKRPFIFWIGLLSRGTFLLFLLCHDAWRFILVSALFFFLNALLMPAVFSMWQANVSKLERSQLWGLTVAITTVIIMASAYVAGVLLDFDSWSYRWLFPVSGLIAITGVALLAQAPLRGRYKLDQTPTPLTLDRVVVQPVRSFIALFSEDRRFLHFEAAFFLYGAALMLLFPLIPHYMADIAGMTYEQAGIASGVLAQLGVLLLSPLWGKVMDRRGPAWLCAIIFAVLALVPLTLIAGRSFGMLGLPVHYAVYLAHIILGIGMSGIHMAWSLGPVSFAGDRDASRYSGAHVTLTGVRGTIAPLLGAIGLIYLGFNAVFVTSAGLFLLGSAGMIHVGMRHGSLRSGVATR